MCMCMCVCVCVYVYVCVCVCMCMCVCVYETHMRRGQSAISKESMFIFLATLSTAYLNSAQLRSFMSSSAGIFLQKSAPYLCHTAYDYCVHCEFEFEPIQVIGVVIRWAFFPKVSSIFMPHSVHLLRRL